MTTPTGLIVDPVTGAMSIPVLTQADCHRMGKKALLEKLNDVLTCLSAAVGLVHVDHITGMPAAITLGEISPSIADDIVPKLNQALTLCNAVLTQEWESVTHNDACRIGLIGLKDKINAAGTYINENMETLSAGF